MLYFSTKPLTNSEKNTGISIPQGTNTSKYPQSIRLKYTTLCLSFSSDSQRQKKSFNISDIRCKNDFQPCGKNKLNWNRIGCIPSWMPGFLYVPENVNVIISQSKLHVPMESINKTSQWLIRLQTKNKMTPNEQITSPYIEIWINN